MMIYKNMKAVVCLLDEDTDFFDIVSGILLGDTLAPYMFIICQDYLLQTSTDLIKENYFTFKKKSQEADDFPQKLWQSGARQILTA